MSQGPVVLVQKEISRKLPDASWSVPYDCELISFSAEDTLSDVLLPLENRSGGPVLSFITIPILGKIRAHYPFLKGSILFPGDLSLMRGPEDPLLWSNFRFRIPVEHQLNPHGHLVPAGDRRMVKIACNSLETDEVFIRPNSPWKPFAGFSCAVDQVDFELAALTQTENLRPGEIILIAPKRQLDPVEWRFHVIDQSLVTWAPYSWDESQALPRTPPEEILSLAGEIASSLYDMDNIVLDLGISDGRPVLIEPNAVSTSGWYPGMDLHALISAALRLYAAPQLQPDRAEFS